MASKDDEIEKCYRLLRMASNDVIRLRDDLGYFTNLLEKHESKEMDKMAMSVIKTQNKKIEKTLKSSWMWKLGEYNKLAGTNYSTFEMLLKIDASQS